MYSIMRCLDIGNIVACFYGRHTVLMEPMVEYGSAMLAAVRNLEMYRCTTPFNASSMHVEFRS